MLEFLPVINLVHVLARLEVANWLIGPGKLTPLEDVGLGGLLLDSIVLFLKGLDLHVGSIGIFKPVDREEISETGSDGFAVDLIVWGAVSTPGALLGVGSCDSVDIKIILKNVLKHGSRLTSLNVNNHLLVHLVLVHELQSFVEFIGIEIST